MNKQQNGQRRPGLSLIELLVVLAIIAGMIGLLFPALHAARESSRGTVCRNNIHQLSLALRQDIDLRKKLPNVGTWPIVLLPWMEEQPLAQAIKDGIKDAALPRRPPLFACPSQNDRALAEGQLRTCWYVLVVDRKKKRWQIHDRPSDLVPDMLRPWYEGPELHPAVFQQQETEERGPHQGQFN